VAAAACDPARPARPGLPAATLWSMTLASRLRRPRGPTAAASLAAALAAGVLAAAASAPWQAARRDLAAVRAVIDGRVPGGGLDPAGAIDRWLADPATAAVDRLAAVAALHDRGRFSWDRRSPEAVHAWLDDAATPGIRGLDERTARLVLGMIASMPDVSEAAVTRTVQAWLAADAAEDSDAAEPPVTRRLRGVLFSRLGLPRLAETAFDAGSPRTRRLRHLALESVPAGVAGEMDAIVRGDGPPPVAAAALIRLAHLEPATVIAGEGLAADLARLAPADAVDLALWVAGRVDPATAASADAALAARAAADRVPAARLRAAAAWSAAHRPPPPPPQVLASADADAGLRAALAAMRGTGDPAAALPLDRDFCDRLAEDPGVPPTLAALVAGDLLPDADAADLAATWVTDLSDRRKHAGAVLLALAGPAAEPDAIDRLRRAHAREDQPEIRLVQHAALAALGRRPTAGPDLRLARHVAAPPLRTTLAVLAALGGEAEALADLLPETEAAAAAASAASLVTLEAAVARLVPHWSAAVGPIPGGGPEARVLQIDRLEARRLVEQPRLRFDPSARRFTLPEDAGLPRAAAATIISP
jgi:hypothetical protein